MFYLSAGRGQDPEARNEVFTEPEADVLAIAEGGLFEPTGQNLLHDACTQLLLVEDDCVEQPVQPRSHR